MLALEIGNISAHVHKQTGNNATTKFEKLQSVCGFIFAFRAVAATIKARTANLASMCCLSVCVERFTKGTELMGVVEVQL